MKRLVKTTIVTLAASLALAMPVKAASGNPIGDVAVGTQLYIWNRVADFLEIVRCGVGFGPSIGAEIAITDKAQLGAYAAKESGVSFPHVLPPLWVVPWLENEPILRHHDGTYRTYAYGPVRWQNSPRDDIRFAQPDTAARVQLGLGLVHLYVGIDLLQVGDFLTGIVGVDLADDDAKADASVRREPARQLGRGVTNILTGVFEIPQSIHLVNQEKGGFAALTYGTLQGLWRFASRELVGVMEVVTFPMGWQPVIEPEFPFQTTRTTDWRVNQPQFMRKF